MMNFGTTGLGFLMKAGRGRRRVELGAIEVQIVMTSARAVSATCEGISFDQMLFPPSLLLNRPPTSLSLVRVASRIFTRCPAPGLPSTDASIPTL